MLNTCLFPKCDEFVEDLIYFNEKYGDTFECDGDTDEVLATFDRGPDVDSTNS
ncbi:hypothetical protein [Escherichia phage TR2]|nr:hypothetical protein [Escherichia phage TR2]